MIKSDLDVWVAAVLATVVVIDLVVVVTVSTHTHQAWWSDMAPSLVGLVVLFFPVAFLAAYKMRQVNILTMELQEIVKRDGLTKVSTRDHFFKTIEKAPGAFGVSLMIDIDHFKNINDTYGHLVGDAVIRDVAQCIRSCCRSEDLVCRFGGEEFVVFLNSADKARGQDVAERIRRTVQDRNITVGESRVSTTISLGGSLKSTTDDIESAIAKADAALYRAKSEGRNRSVLDWFQEKILSRGLQA